MSSLSAATLRNRSHGHNLRDDVSEHAGGQVNTPDRSSDEGGQGSDVLWTRMSGPLGLLSFPLRVLLGICNLVPSNCRAALVTAWALILCYIEGPHAEFVEKKTDRHVSDFYNPLITLAVISVIARSCTRTRLWRQRSSAQENAAQQTPTTGGHLSGNQELRAFQVRRRRRSESEAQPETAFGNRKLLMKRMMHVLPWLIMGLLWMGLKQLARVRVTEWRYM